jgi:mannosyltransferase
MSVRLRDRLPLSLILLLGTALRLHRLGADSFWYDETVSVYLAGSPLGELIRHTAGDIHPPGYYVLLRGWLLATNYPTGHADPGGIGLEFTAGFFSLACGVALIALVYSLARAIGGRSTSLASAAIVAVSPYNIWYSQEARMYTLAAGLGMVTLIALLKGVGLTGNSHGSVLRRLTPWAIYALAAAAGLYIVYYFAFLVLALNLWILTLILFRKIRRDRSLAWLLANLVALILYAPWIPLAWRQATSPPVPPWRSAVGLVPALRESWTALSLGQSAPAWAWPVLLLALLLYVVGLLSLFGRAGREVSARAESASPGTATGDDGSHPLAASFLPVATFGSLALILLGSAVASPLYHVRYLFTYSPEFYIVLAAGLRWLWRRWRVLAVIVAAVWVTGASATLYAFWHDPAYRPDDLRGAASYLESHWRPGDVVLLNAGYAYPGLLTYWQGPVGPLVRLTATLPAAGTDASLVAVMTGHVNGEPNLGWGDRRSDFFAMPADQAADGLKTLFGQFSRVWHYRIYDTVSDPGGFLRAAMEQEGQPIEDRVFAGEANMRVQGFVPRSGARWATDRPTVRYPSGQEIQWETLASEVVAGQTIYPMLTWRAVEPPGAPVATSIRLIGADGTTWSQPPDERPLGELFTTDRWSEGQIARQPLALPVPPGTPPGDYVVELVVYDPASGASLTPDTGNVPKARTPGGISLGRITVRRPGPSGATLPGLGRFGPLAVVEASTPATTVKPGDAIPVELVWQAVEAPQEPMVVVLQLLDREDRVAVGLEAQPLDGRYPTQDWAAGELVRDRHTLTLPTKLAPGSYRLIVGVYRAADRQRLQTQSGPFGESDQLAVKQIQVR